MFAVDPGLRHAERVRRIGHDLGIQSGVFTHDGDARLPRACNHVADEQMPRGGESTLSREKPDRLTADHQFHVDVAWTEHPVVSSPGVPAGAGVFLDLDGGVVDQSYHGTERGKELIPTTQEQPDLIGASVDQNSGLVADIGNRIDHVSYVC
jgi:hypothetical protein